MPGAWCRKRTATRPAYAFPSWKSPRALRPNGLLPLIQENGDRTSKDNSGLIRSPGGAARVLAARFQANWKPTHAQGKRTKTIREWCKPLGTNGLCGQYG